MDSFEWARQFRASVKRGEVPCIAECGDAATVARTTGKRIGGWCRGCFNELEHGVIPPLDRPRGVKRPTQSRKNLMR